MSRLVLAIDDDKLVHKIIEDALAQSCKLIHAKNGDEGLRLALKYHPDIILLDVEMPGLNGFEVCEKLKKSPDTLEIPVMFLSSRKDISERMRGYNSGASDYIIKPFNREELLARINVLDDYRQTSQRLKKDIEQAQITAEIAMTDSGDMGRIMRYVGQSYHAHDFDTLSEFFFEFFIPLQLEVAVAFWHQQGEVYKSAEGIIQPIEQELLEQNRTGNRFVDFGCRTIINYPKVSLLIKNMPTDDPGLYGRYKDLLPHILEATNSKIQDMEDSEQALNQVGLIGQVCDDIAQQLVYLDMHHNSQSENLKSLIEQATERPESLANITNTEQLSEFYQHFGFLNEELGQVKQKLSIITDTREALHMSLNKLSQPWSEDQVPSQDDIELF
ncbi:two-component system response regulator [Pseudoalteromonas phenolica]|uniref:Two-component system response regulator n=1 Tax=Pseudoalteromonas phenolica TaxID=161398 RepID=A0A5S3YTK6_9GAMM|nr:response regulator [Pseudoalteromonas phenolica]TMN91706.1 two-component system response regulator [Pseudoalteromonas phenolica]TMP80030.1 two-component system response regulator [Pseudoalteromonas phenolica]